ncbi:MAG: von Willebrand factor type A domain-containing protein [Prevotella sp.]|nr:von Willebrand factor type A domain-containing protein [Prevotella sp.]
MKKNIQTLLPAALALLIAACSTTGDSYYEAPMPQEAFYGYTNDEPMPPQQGGGDRFEAFADNPFVAAAKQPTSTFSVDADGASYAIMRRFFSSGYWDLQPSSVRIEEFLNYFTFDYPAPTGNDNVAINAEAAACPWNAEHLLLRLGIKGKELAPAEVPLANFVFLVDVSGSMDGSDRLDLLKAGLRELLYQLNPDDRISLITYSGEVKKLLESTPVREAGKIEKAINQLKASGCTAGGEALKMAYEEALANYDATKNNRVIMGTDGDFNVGVTSTEALVEMVESYAKRGIYMTCLGFGMGNLNDAMMERISNKGNGTYHYIDCEDEMMKVMVHERERFVSVANDAKCQVTFDSTVVSEYRLIGYENRVMSNEDFEDDEKDAAEIGAGQTITALYEVVLTEDASKTLANKVLATFDFRYKKSLNGASIPLKKQLTLIDAFNKKARSADFSFAAGVAAYGMLLRQSPYKGDATFDMAERLVNEGLSFDPHGYRAKLLSLIKLADQMKASREVH